MNQNITINVTLDGLHQWLKHEYEHLGWMALSLESGHSERAYAFAVSIGRLKKAIEERQAIQTTCNHTIKDLEVLTFKVNNLIKFAEKLGITKNLKDSICAQQEGGAKSKKTKSGSKKSGSKKSGSKKSVVVKKSRSKK